MSESTYDFTSSRARANPHPVYERMRAEAPVYRLPEPDPVTGGAVWLLTRYRDCWDMLHDPRFGREYHRLLTPGQRERHPIGAVEWDLLSYDPPEHTRLRQLMRRMFILPAVRAMQPRMEDLAGLLVDSMPADGVIDLVADFTFPFTATLIAEMLGIPAGDRARFRSWTERIFNGVDRAVSYAAHSLPDTFKNPIKG
ncbi:MAG: cytochrome P450 [Anaerolineae bacterium]|nr:cytochrome P450 [Anaerolineae bacterium]